MCLNGILLLFAAKSGYQTLFLPRHLVISYQKYTLAGPSHFRLPQTYKRRKVIYNKQNKKFNSPIVSVQIAFTLPPDAGHEGVMDIRHDMNTFHELMACVLSIPSFISFLISKW